MLWVPVLLFHLSLHTTKPAAPLHMGHCARDCGHTQLPRGCCREQPMGTPESGPGASELASAPSLSSPKCPLQVWAALLTCPVEKGSRRCSLKLFFPGWDLLTHCSCLSEPSWLFVCLSALREPRTKQGQLADSKCCGW